MKDKVIRTAEHSTKQKLLDQLHTLYNAMTGLGNEGKAGYFTKAFGFVSQEIQTLDAGVECGPNQHVQNPEWIV